MSTVLHQNDEEQVRIQATGEKTNSSADWFFANMVSLYDRFGTDWLAIADNAVIAHAASTKELRSQLDSLEAKRRLITRINWDPRLQRG